MTKLYLLKSLVLFINNGILLAAKLLKVIYLRNYFIQFYFKTTIDYNIFDFNDCFENIGKFTVYLAYFTIFYHFIFHMNHSVNHKHSRQ